MDVLELSRWQFAITTIYHFLFVPLTLGLSIFLALLETCSVITKRPAWKEQSRKLAKFFGTIFLINFGMGVVTGIVQEFHFGMNWSEYARFMGDIFGAPLALEALTAFFLESTFLGIWIFGWDRLSPKVHCATIWITAIASNLSAFWILVANGFMQHPVGYAIEDGRAVMTDVFALVTNPYAIGQYMHTLFSGIVTAGMLLLAITAYKILAGGEYRAAFQKVLCGVALYLLVGLFAVMGTGHLQAQQVAHMQPMKLASMEALWETEDPAPFTIFADINVPGQRNNVEITVPYVLSFMVYNAPAGEIKGIRDLQLESAKKYGPGVYMPNDILGLFVSFRGMIAMGGLMMLFAFGALVLGWYKKSSASWERKRSNFYVKWFLRLSVLALPLPFIANTLGWYLTEAGRQPWIVVGLQKTASAYSPNLTTGDVFFSLAGFTVVYLVLALAALYSAIRYIRRHPMTPPVIAMPDDDEEGREF